MVTNFRAKFDWFVLKPLWVVFIILAVYYFSQGSWFIGSLMIIMDFLLGMIAASLHKGKTFHDFAQGYPTRDEVSRELETGPTDEELYFVWKSISKLMFLFGICSLILTFHHGVKWYYAIGLSVLIGCLGPLLWAIPFWYFLWRHTAHLRH